MVEALSIFIHVILLYNDGIACTAVNTGLARRSQSQVGYDSGNLINRFFVERKILC
jgi:hypothetical protein